MVQGLMAPLRVVLQRSFADWLILVATWLVIVCATTLVAIGVLYGDAVAFTGLRQVIAERPATETSIVVQMRASADALPEIEPVLDRQVGRILGWTGGELNTVVRSETYALPDRPSDELTDLALFGDYEGIEHHSELLGGAWPRAGTEPMEVALSRATADRLELSVGDELSLTSQRGRDRTVQVRVVGVWEPIDVDDPFWRADPFELEGVTEGSSFITHGPFVVDRADLLDRVATGNVSLEARALPDFSRLDLDDVNWMRSDTAALERRLGEALGARTVFQVSTDLDAILESADRSLLVTRSGVVVLTIQFAVLAGYALLLVAGLLVDGRRVETALLRSRGAGLAQVALFSFVEALVLVVPAVLAAPWLAVAMLELLNVAGPLADAGIRIEPRVDETALIAAASAGVAAVVGLVLPVLGAGRGLAAVRQTISRQGSRTLAQRLGFDMALVVLAGIGLWQLRQYGAPLTETVRGTVGLDPLLVAAPAIGLLAGSILALRIVPLAAEVGERLLAGRRGLVAPLGARQLARRPLRYTRSALLLMLAAALGTFAGAYASTWTRSQADQAAYHAGADVRVELSSFPDLPGWSLGQAYRSIDGVDSAMPATAQRFDVSGGGQGQILAIDAGNAASIIRFRPDLAHEPIGDLLDTLPEAGGTSGIALGGEPAAFALDVTALLAHRETADPDEPVAALDPGWRGILPAIVVRDADGLVHRLEGGRLAVGLGAQRLEVSAATSIASATPRHPLELIGIELRVELPEAVIALGSLSVDALGVAPSSAGPWSAVPLDGLSWSRTVAGLDVVPIASEIVEASEQSPIQDLGPGTDVLFRLAGPIDGGAPTPALAGSRLAESMGVAVGDTVEVGTLGARRSFVIAGIVEGFPTLDPNAPFLVADLGTLAAADMAAGRALSATSWWLTVADGRSADVAETLGDDPYSAGSVVAFEELHREMLGDPVALGLIGALALGALAAIVFAGIGFIVSATVSTRERLGEFALLQAIGLSHRQLSAWIWMENAFLLLIGLLTGSALGLVLAWVVLPFVALTQEATLAVPPVEVVIPWGIYGLLYLAALSALAVTVLVIGRLLGRVRVSGVLRAGGE